MQLRAIAARKDDRGDARDAREMHSHYYGRCVAARTRKRIVNSVCVVPKPEIISIDPKFAAVESGRSARREIKVHRASASTVRTVRSIRGIRGAASPRER